MSDETYDLSLLESSAKKWKNSPALRVAYGDIYLQMQREADPGPALEIGSGCGLIREFIDHVVTSDIRHTRFVDRVASAYAIEEVSGGPWQTVYLLDVLHHLCRPFEFFASAARSLQTGGRIILVEPAATFLGRGFYRLFHHEPMDVSRIQAPYDFSGNADDNEFANMGMAWSLFVRDRTQAIERLARMGLTLKTLRFRDVLAYPSTGGFSKASILPSTICRALLKAERQLPQGVMRLIGLRMMIVLEKTARGPGE